MLLLCANPMYQATNITALNTGLIHTESGDCADSEDMHLSDAHKKAAQGEPCTAYLQHPLISPSAGGY